MKENEFFELSKVFAVRIVKLYKFLTENKKNMFFQSKFFVQVQVSEQILQKLRLLSVKKTFLRKCIYLLRNVQKLFTGWIYYLKQNI